MDLFLMWLSGALCIVAIVELVNDNAKGSLFYLALSLLDLFLALGGAK